MLLDRVRKLVGLTGYALLDVLWRYNVRKRYRDRVKSTSR